jgi:hypothetical protein
MRLAKVEASAIAQGTANSMANGEALMTKQRPNAQMADSSFGNLSFIQRTALQTVK